jgi:hypothetical protein
LNTPNPPCKVSDMRPTRAPRLSQVPAIDTRCTWSRNRSAATDTATSDPGVCCRNPRMFPSLRLYSLEQHPPAATSIAQSADKRLRLGPVKLRMPSDLGRNLRQQPEASRIQTGFGANSPERFSRSRKHETQSKPTTAGRSLSLSSLLVAQIEPGFLGERETVRGS